MKNTFINKFDSLIKISISGRGVNRFIDRLYKNKINMYDINKISRNKVILKVNYYDYERITKLKSIYEINSMNTYGIIKIKKLVNKNRFMIISLLFSFFVIMFLSNIIFNINIVHSSKEIRNLISRELESNGIKKYGFKKEYSDLQKIKEKILKNNKDKLEWLEIENIGTTVRVKCEERILNSNEKVYPYQNIVAQKDGIVNNIYAKDGFIKYEIGDYVKKGDVLISGEIYDPNGKFLGLSEALGDVYAEVWYKVHITYPLYYSEIKYTGNKINSYDLVFLNKRFSLKKDKFKDEVITDKVVVSNNIFNIGIFKSKKEEVEKIDSINTYSSALIEAENKAKEEVKYRESIKDKSEVSKIVNKKKKENKRTNR